MPSHKPSSSSRPSLHPSFSPTDSTSPSFQPSYQVSRRYINCAHKNVLILLLTSLSPLFFNFLPSSFEINFWFCQPTTSSNPTLHASDEPSLSTSPSTEPSANPSSSGAPSSIPSSAPSSSVEPTLQPSYQPSMSDWPSALPSLSPTSSNIPSYQVSTYLVIFRVDMVSSSFCHIYALLLTHPPIPRLSCILAIVSTY